MELAPLSGWYRSKKTDGRPAELNGVKIYTLMFAASVEFDSASMYTGGNPLVGQRITTTAYHKPSTQGFSWDDYLISDVQGYSPAMRGDRLNFAGEVSFEKRESGWFPLGSDWRFQHDSSLRKPDYPQNSLESRYYSLKFANHAAPHIGLIGGYRTGNVCLSIGAPVDMSIGRLRVPLKQFVSIFGCDKGPQDGETSWGEALAHSSLLNVPVVENGTRIDAKTAFRIVRSGSPDTIQIVADQDITFQCETCATPVVLIREGQSFRLGRAFEVPLPSFIANSGSTKTDEAH